MEVTRSNFPSFLTEMVDAINSATFVSVDGEFTGLNAGGNSTNHLDSPKMRYHKLIKNDRVVDFMLLQVGICTFHQDETTNSLVARPYNVFLFPRSPVGTPGGSHPNAVFKCQVSSVDFLAAQNFDFNKAFKEGVGYFPLIAHQKLEEDFLQKEKEQLMLEVMQRDRRGSFPSPGVPSNTHGTQSQAEPSQQPNGQMEVPPEQRPYLDDVETQIEKFLADASKVSLDLPPTNAFQRKLVFETVQNKYAAALQAESRIKSTNERYVCLTKGGEEVKKKLAEERSKEKRRLIEEALGFTKVIKALADSDKLIVGHNMLLDILHLLHNFVLPDLPDDYDDFKSLLHETFPHIVDTKRMATGDPLKEHISDHSLGKLRDRLQRPPFPPLKISLAPGCERYERKPPSEVKSNGECSGHAAPADSGPLHEAGYDAFITGVCFATMVTHLSGNAQIPSISPTSPFVKPYLNKIPLIRIMSDSSYMNLDGPDENPPRDHVFHLTFPPDWRYPEIYQLFRDFGQIFIGWIDDTHAFITLKNPVFSAAVSKCLCSSSSSSSPSPSATYRLIPFSEYLETFWSEAAPRRSSPVTTASELTPRMGAAAASSGGKRSASQAGLETAAPSTSGNSRSSPPSGVDDGSDGGAGAVKRFKSFKRSVTSMAAAALAGRREGRAPLVRPPPPGFTAADSAGGSGADRERFSWTKNYVSRAKDFLNRAVSGASSTKGDDDDAAAPSTGATESKASSLATDVAGSKRGAEGDEEREEEGEGESARSTENAVATMKKKKFVETTIGEGDEGKEDDEENDEDVEDKEEWKIETEQVSASLSSVDSASEKTMEEDDDDCDNGDDIGRGKKAKLALDESLHDPSPPPQTIEGRLGRVAESDEEKSTERREPASPVEGIGVEGDDDVDVEDDDDEDDDGDEGIDEDSVKGEGRDGNVALQQGATERKC